MVDLPPMPAARPGPSAVQKRQDRDKEFEVIVADLKSDREKDRALLSESARHIADLTKRIVALERAKNPNEELKGRTVSDLIDGYIMKPLIAWWKRRS